MMQITRAEIIAVTLLIHQSRLTVPPASLNFTNRAVQPYARTDHNQRPAVKPDIATVNCLTDITTINHGE